MKGAIPFALEMDDSDGLGEACRDAWAVFTLIPPSMAEEDYEAYQDRVGEAIVKAIQMANVTRVVNLSSIGAHLAEGTGPIKGLHRQEERLNALKNLHCLVHLRPEYFMENLYGLLPMVQQGVIKSCLPGNLMIPMVATRDIGWKAVDFLDNSAPQLHLTFEL